MPVEGIPKRKENHDRDIEHGGEIALRKLENSRRLVFSPC
jgi:hypothetical protein